MEQMVGQKPKQELVKAIASSIGAPRNLVRVNHQGDVVLHLGKAKIPIDWQGKQADFRALQLASQVRLC